MHSGLSHHAGVKSLRRVQRVVVIPVFLVLLGGGTPYSQDLVPADPVALAEGFSTDELTGRIVVNANLDPIGDIDDFIIAPKQKAALAVIDVGDYLRTAARLVAVPVEHLVLDDPSGEVMLPRATREQLRKLPVYIPGP
jgi:hypothetical protein